MITKITIKNFKAVQSATIKLADLTVFVGNNGSGKSSVIEAMQTLQNILLYGISTGFNERWFGIEHIRNTFSKPDLKNANIFQHDIEIEMAGKIGKEKYLYAVRFNATSNGDMYLVTYEHLKRDKETIFSAQIIDENGNAELFWGSDPEPKHYLANRLIVGDQKLSENNVFVQKLADYIVSWQFLFLDPERMYYPTRRDYAQTQIRMRSTGENLADFFSRLQDDADRNNTILEKMRYVLPELENLGREEITVQKQIYLYLQNNLQEKRLPSWLFSSGTLRILAMLAILNSINIPPVIFIEEIENGLDPRTINLLLEEIRGLLPEHQFVVTTHSPFFLNMVELRHIVVAERENNKTSYYRPGNDKRLDDWKEKFAVGELYIMDKLRSL